MVQSHRGGCKVSCERGWAVFFPSKAVVMLMDLLCWLLPLVLKKGLLSAGCLSECVLICLSSMYQLHVCSSVYCKIQKRIFFLILSGQQSIKNTCRFTCINAKQKKIFFRFYLNSICKYLLGDSNA